VSGEPVVQVRSLCKEFRLQRGWKETLLRPRQRDIRVALDGVSLEVRPGEFFGLLGPNGAGKTTFFKILATLVTPNSGSASVCGFDVTKDPAQVRRRLVPVIPNERSLYWRLSARENLLLYASLYGLNRAAARARIAEVIEIVGLGDAGGKQVGLFSSGMKQRLMIARALLGQPDVLLLDEPTRSLDPLSAREFRAFLRRQIGGARGTAVLLATHDHEEVTELCDRVAVLDRGRLLAVGETEALLASSRLRRCSIWTSNPRHPAVGSSIASLGGRILDVEAVALPGTSAWYRVRIEVPIDEAGAARLVTMLTSAGIPVSRFTREDLSLADLLEKVMKRHGMGGEEEVA
jgi:ABC-2 type transport system ATP-binding protein